MIFFSLFKNKVLAGEHRNMRELRNVLERIVSFLEGDVIRLRDIPFNLYRNRVASAASDKHSLKQAQHRAEKDAIIHALAVMNKNKSRAAEFLGIHRTLLYKKMRKFNIPMD
jgi:transcriptional regulator of acetoin/glycerol metabolism